MYAYIPQCRACVRVEGEDAWLVLLAPCCFMLPVCVSFLGSPSPPIRFFFSSSPPLFSARPSFFFPAVASKMAYCYEYGIKMFTRGLIKEDDLKQVVIEKLAGRVGLDGPKFDQWLGTPAVV